MLRLLHKCDLFRVVQDKENHLTPATAYGAAVSIATAVLLTLLLLGETYEYFSGHKACHLTPSTFKHTLSDAAQQAVDTIHFAVSVPYIPCDRVVTETVTAHGHDAAAEAQTRVHLYHIPYGVYVEETTSPYREGELASDKMRGCYLVGTTGLSIIRASFNIIIKDFKVPESSKYRPDFRVGQFYVGNAYRSWGVPQIRQNTLQPLATFQRSLNKPVPYFYQFYLQLIPTTVDRPGEDDRFGYQYTSYYSIIRYNGLGRAPGLYFSYQPASYSMNCKVSYDTVSHFIVNLCAVAGGVYTVAGLVEEGLEWAARSRRRREVAAQNRCHVEAMEKGVRQT